MDLADACGSEWVQVDLSEVLLPISSIATLKRSDDLLDRHDVSLASRFLHRISDNRRQNTALRSRQNLAYLQRRTSHLSERFLKPICILLIDRVLRKTLLSLLVSEGLFDSNLLF